MAMQFNIGRRIDQLKSRFERLSQRERVMVLSLAGTFALCVMIIMGFWMVSEVDDMADENEAARHALKELDRLKDRYLEERSKLESLKSRMSPEHLELNSYVEKAASEGGVKIGESSETTPTEVGALTQRGLEIKLRQVSLSQLTSFLMRLENDPSHIVQVTRLDISTRWKKNEELDVAMIVSTFDRTQATDKAKEESE